MCNLFETWVWFHYSVYQTVCFASLRFRLRLSLSVNSRMICVQLNCRLAVSDICAFLLKTAEWKFGRTFQNIYIFECEWLNGNSNDLWTAKLPFGSSHSNSNAIGNWGIQNAHPAAMYPDVSKTDLWWGETAQLCGILRYACVGHTLNYGIHLLLWRADCTSVDWITTNCCVHRLSHLNTWICFYVTSLNSFRNWKQHFNIRFCTQPTMQWIKWSPTLRRIRHACNNHRCCCF